MHRTEAQSQFYYVVVHKGIVSCMMPAVNFFSFFFECSWAFLWYITRRWIDANVICSICAAHLLITDYRIGIAGICLDGMRNTVSFGTKKNFNSLTLHQKVQLQFSQCFSKSLIQKYRNNVDFHCFAVDFPISRYWCRMNANNSSVSIQYIYVTQKTVQIHLQALAAELTAAWCCQCKRYVAASEIMRVNRGYWNPVNLDFFM